MIDGRLGADFRPEGLGRRRDGQTQPTGASLGETPRSECPVDLAHVMMQQNVCRSRRTHPEECSDDAAHGHGGLEDFGFKPEIKKIQRAHGHELHVQVHEVRAESPELLGQTQQTHDFRGVQRGRVRGRRVDDLLEKLRHLGHGKGEFRGGLRVLRAEAGYLTPRAMTVRPSTQGIAIRQGQEGAFQRDKFHAVFGKFQLADDVGPKQAHHIGTHREMKAGVKLLGHRRSAQHMTAFENQDALSRLGEVSGAHQSVMPAADDDGIVGFRHQLRFLGGSKNGFLVTVAVMRFRSYSTVTSIFSLLPISP